MPAEAWPRSAAVPPQARQLPTSRTPAHSRHARGRPLPTSWSHTSPPQNARCRYLHTPCRLYLKASCQHGRGRPPLRIPPHLLRSILTRLLEVHLSIARSAKIRARGRWRAQGQHTAQHPHGPNVQSSCPAASTLGRATQQQRESAVSIHRLVVQKIKHLGLSSARQQRCARRFRSSCSQARRINQPAAPSTSPDNPVRPAPGNVAALMLIVPEATCCVRTWVARAPTPPSIPLLSRGLHHGMCLQGTCADMLIRRHPRPLYKTAARLPSLRPCLARTTPLPAG